MLILSREPGASITITSSVEHSVVTLLKVDQERRTISLRFRTNPIGRPEAVDVGTAEIAVDASVPIASTAQVTLVRVLHEKAHIGISAPRETEVHRLEVYEAIHRGNPGHDPESGGDGSRVPRPSPSNPPSLDVRLDEPRSGE